MLVIFPLEVEIVVVDPLYRRYSVCAKAALVLLTVIDDFSTWSELPELVLVPLSVPPVNVTAFTTVTAHVAV